MPSLQGRFFNAANRLFIRRRYGNDEYALAKQARRIWGSPRFWQWLHSRGLNVKTVDENGVRGEWLEAENAVQKTLFYIHGGGFVCCSARTHRPITATLARETGFRVFSLKYRLAPEDRFPAALDDAFDAYRWLLGQNIAPSEIALAGDSAGGGLVLALLLRLREAKLPLPACAACFSPWSDLLGTGESNRANAARDAMFYPENTQEFARAYLGEASADNPYASPVFGDFKDLPPILFHVGSTEMLLDDSRRIHQKIQAGGGASELEIYEDTFHCWQMAVGLVPEARDSLAKAARFIRRNT
jgi:epsilon-lactone hydrolase